MINILYIGLTWLSPGIAVTRYGTALGYGTYNVPVLPRFLDLRNSPSNQSRLRDLADPQNSEIIQITAKLKRCRYIPVPCPSMSTAQNRPGEANALSGDETGSSRRPSTAYVRVRCTISSAALASTVELWKLRGSAGELGRLRRNARHRSVRGKHNI